MTRTLPAWNTACLEFVLRIKPNVHIRALRLDEQQWAEYSELIGGTPRTLWGYPVKKRS
jgi:hypothetical protein